MTKPPKDKRTPFLPHKIVSTKGAKNRTEVAGGRMATSTIKLSDNTRGGLAELEGKSASKSQSKTRQKVSRNNVAQGTLAQAASRTDQAKAQVKRNKRIIEAQKKERSKGKKK